MMVVENYTKKEIDMHGVYYYNSEVKCHRLDGPAVEYVNGDKYWIVDGNRHRLDGPAIMCSDGYKEWWINNEEYNKSKHNRLALFYVLEYKRMG